MSQAKVDKYKEEKKNRAKIIKRQKIAKVVGVLVAALGIGAIIGVPLGKYIYNEKKEEEARKRTVSASNLDTWYEEYWGKNYSDLMTRNGIDDLMDQVDFATASDADAESLDVDDNGVDIDYGDIEVEDGEDISIDDLENAED